MFNLGAALDNPHSGAAWEEVVLFVIEHQVFNDARANQLKRVCKTFRRLVVACEVAMASLLCKPVIGPKLRRMHEVYQERERLIGAFKWKRSYSFSGVWREGSRYYYGNMEPISIYCRIPRGEQTDVLGRPGVYRACYGDVAQLGLSLPPPNTGAFPLDYHRLHRNTAVPFFDRIKRPLCRNDMATCLCLQCDPFNGRVIRS